MTANSTQEHKSGEPDVEIVVPEPAQTEPRARDRSDGVKPEPEQVTSTSRPRSISISLRGLVKGLCVVALVAAIAALGWLYFDAHRQLDALAAQSANDARAEQIALDYAVNAAAMDFKDLQAWQVKLVEGTSPELKEKLSEAGKSMEQVLVPLEWSSTAEPLVAKVRSVNDGIYVVDSFVSVQTKTVQAPEALQSTATYSTTIDSNNNWQITDVGGIGSTMGPK